ncbi:hypothetical protein ACSSS7_005411 [Eimeria intestinalis]
MASPPDWEPVGEASDGLPIYEVESILDQRGEGDTARYLVKWKGFAESDATWEPLANLDNFTAFIILIAQGAAEPIRAGLKDKKHAPHDYDLQLDGSSIDNNGGAILVDCSESRRRRLAHLLKAIALLAIHGLTLLLISLICARRPNDVVQGVQGRRLAEGGGQEGQDITPPSTPELLELCMDLQDDFFSEAFDLEALPPFLSLVQALDGTEEDKESARGSGPRPLPEVSPEPSQESFALGHPLKRPEVAEDDGEASAPPSKVSRKDTELSPPVAGILPVAEELSPVSAADLEAGVSQSTQPFASSDSDPSGVEQISDASLALVGPFEPSSGPSSMSGAVVPSSAAFAPGPSSDPSDDNGNVHPWLRVPSLLPGVAPLLFRPERLVLFTSYQTHVDLMLNMRELLRKPSLDQSEADQLLCFAELLACHAYQRMSDPLDTKRPADAATRMARRFMVFYLLHLTSKALKQRWQDAQWWRDLASAIPTEDPFGPGDPRLWGTGWRSITLTMRLSAALEEYKNGGAPRDEEVVQLMREIFGTRGGPIHLRAAVWKPWREDDKGDT